MFKRKIFNISETSSAAFLYYHQRFVSSINKIHNNQGRGIHSKIFRFRSLLEENTFGIFQCMRYFNFFLFHNSTWANTIVHLHLLKSLMLCTLLLLTWTHHEIQNLASNPCHSVCRKTLIASLFIRLVKLNLQNWIYI